MPLPPPCPPAMYGPVDVTLAIFQTIEIEHHDQCGAIHCQGKSDSEKFWVLLVFVPLL